MSGKLPVNAVTRAVVLAVVAVVTLSPVQGCLPGSSDGTDSVAQESLELAHHSADEEGSEYAAYSKSVNHINNSYTGGEDVYASSSISCGAGWYSPDAGQWIYWLDLDGEGWASDDMFLAAAFGIDGTSSSEALVLDMVDNSRYLWSISSSTSGSDLDRISEFVVGLAMSAIASAGASIAWTLASELISCFGSDGTDDSVNGDNLAWRLWEWSPNESEVSQYAKFMVFVDPGETVSFTAEYMLFGYGYEYVCGGLYEVTITAPTDPTADGTDVEVETSNGVAAVDVADVSGSSEYSEVLLAMEEAGFSDDTVYVETNPQVTITVSDPTAALCSCIEDADGLLEACYAQISRSVKIVNAFSAGEVTARDAEVVERHQALIDSLEIVVDSLAAGGSDGFDRLYAEYVEATEGFVTSDAVIELRMQ